MISNYASNLPKVILLSAAFCAAILAAGCSNSPAASGGPAANGGPAKAAREPAPVRIAAATRQAMPVQLAAIGLVEAYSTIQVKAQVSGEVKQVQFKEGDVVEEGQVLFTVDARPFDVALKEAEANRAKAEAQLEQARANKARDQAQADNARRDLERDTPLVDKAMVSQEEFDKVRSTAESAQAAVAADEAANRTSVEAIRGAEAAIEDAKLQLDYCTIRSPIKGRTGSLLIHRGNLIRANDVSPLVVITQTQPIYVSFTVAEENLAQIRSHMVDGQPLQVQAIIPGQEDKPASGVLTFIDNTVDTGTGTIRLKATFENVHERLWPGQFVTVVLQMAVQADAIVVPAQAVQAGQSGSFVYVVKADLTVELRNVTPGDTLNNLTIIKEGIEPDEKVITDGQVRVSPGAPVKVVTGESATEGKTE